MGLLLELRDKLGRNPTDDELRQAVRERWSALLRPTLSTYLTAEDG
jgi:hypothetical protein